MSKPAIRQASSSLVCIASILLLNINLASWAGLFQLSQNQELTLGRQAAAQVERSQPILKDSNIGAYIDELGQHLVRRSIRGDIPYTFKVVNSTDINAFALPGGFIYINRGLIESADTENELVGVMAHEVSHVAARHSVEQMAKVRKTSLGFAVAGTLLNVAGVRGAGTLMNGADLVARGVFLKFSRDAEREADQLGAKNMYEAGWNPEGMKTFFNKLASKGGSRSAAFFSTHPSPAERENNISELIAQWQNKDKIVDSKKFKSIKVQLANMPPPDKVISRVR